MRSFKSPVSAELADRYSIEEIGTKILQRSQDLQVDFDSYSIFHDYFVHFQSSIRKGDINSKSLGHYAMSSPFILYELCLILQTDPAYIINTGPLSDCEVFPVLSALSADSVSKIKERVMGKAQVSVRLRQFRRNCNVSIGAAAKSIGTSVGTMSNYETPGRSIRLSCAQFYHLAALYNADPDIIMLGVPFMDAIMNDYSKLEPIDMEQRTITPISQTIYKVGDILRAREWIINNIENLDGSDLLRIQSIMEQMISQDSSML